MKLCSVCGNENIDAALFCSSCGTPFPAEPASEPVAEVIAEPAPSLSEPAEISAPRPRSEEAEKNDRMALAGFVLALMGSFTVITSPLQLTALILSSVSRPENNRTLRRIGIILSSVSLVISLVLWVVLFVFGQQVLPYFTEAMNQLYY